MSAVSILMTSAGGLALFLYGLRVLSTSLKRVVGARMVSLFERLTGRAYRGLIVGAATSGMLQSSSMTMVLLIGLINASALTLKQGIGLMLGSEVGTTITAQLVAFKIGAYALPVLAIGFALSEIFRGRRAADVGRILLGFGLLFLGMNILSGGLHGLAESALVLSLFRQCSSQPLLGILVGAGVTAVIQSSSATTAVVIALGAADLVTLPAAIALALGANIGTTVTGQIASIGASLSARRLARTQLLVNVAGVALISPFIPWFSHWVSLTSASLPRQIANAHTLFNATMALAMLPAVGGLAWIAQRMVTGQDAGVRAMPAFLSKQFLSTPSVALTQARKELMRMTAFTERMITLCRQGLLQQDPHALVAVLEIEQTVDILQHSIEEYLDHIPVDGLSEKESHRLHLLQHVTGDVERVGDQAVNIAQRSRSLLQASHALSSAAREDLDHLFQTSMALYARALAALSVEDPDLAEEALRLEDEVDRLERMYKEHHLVRLGRGECDPSAGILYVEILHNLERIGDHAVNIAGDVLQALRGSGTDL